MIASLDYNVAPLLSTSRLELTEKLENAKLGDEKEVKIDFELIYYSPDSEIRDWRRQEAFNAGLISEEVLHQDPDIEEFGDTKSLLGTSMDGQSENEPDVLSEWSGLSTNKHRTQLPILDPTLHKMDDFQISVTVIEASKLIGANLNPCVQVFIGDRLQETEVKLGTNAPHFNQYLCFEFSMPKSMMLDQVLRLRCVSFANPLISRIFGGDLIGEFRMDLKTIYSTPEHGYQGKWAVLVDPKDALSGIRGYVKLDIAIHVKGEPMRKPKKSKTDDSKEDNIEANLLMPQFLSTSQSQQMADLSVKIYCAEDLPKMNTDFMASLKETLTRSKKPQTDPFVQVSFAGHIGKTKVKKSTYSPEFNENIIFTEMFPPFCNRIRISILDYDPVNPETIATHFIEIADIMNNSDKDGFLPTFGPAWINLYGTPRNYGIEHSLNKNDELNLGIGKGVAYRGRILVEIRCVLKSEASAVRTGVRVETVPPATDAFLNGKKEDYLLTGVIYMTSAIDQSVGTLAKPVQFELSMSKIGNHLDGTQKNEPNPVFLPNAPKKPPMWNYSITPAKLPESLDGQYYEVEFGKSKPCLYMIGQYDDHRLRMVVPNILDKIIAQFDDAVRVLQTGIEMKIQHAAQFFESRVIALKAFVEQASSDIENCKGLATKTVLDKNRSKTIKITLQKILVKLTQMLTHIQEAEVSSRTSELKAMMKKIVALNNEPQHALPDVFLWMLVDGKRQAFTRLEARKLFYSNIETEKGCHCGKILTLFLQRPGKKGAGVAGWVLQCQVQILLWLGPLREMSNFRRALPEGFDDTFSKTNRPPMEIQYLDIFKYQLRAHLYMGRNLIGSDDSGLSDAFARIILGSHVLSTKTIYETLSPNWDETIVVPSIEFCINPQTLKAQPPTIVVELYDKDMIGDPEFLGRCFCEPLLVTGESEDDEYFPPVLQMHSIRRGDVDAGEILAAFELILLKPDGRFFKCSSVPALSANRAEQRRKSLAINLKLGMDKVSESTVPFSLPIPMMIRPKLKPFRLEVLFWGIRELQKLQFIQVRRPKVKIEINSHHLQSDMIPDALEKPNFPRPVKHLDLRLPENRDYWPPIMIQVEDTRQFGSVVLVGNHVVTNVLDFVRSGKQATQSEKYTYAPIANMMRETYGILNQGFEDDQVGAKRVNFGTEEEGLEGMEMQNLEVEIKPKKIPFPFLRRDKDTHAGDVIKIKKRVPIPKDEQDSADWWSKYYASLSASGEDEHEGGEEEEDNEVDVLKDIKVTYKESKDDEAEDDLDEKERKRRSLFKLDPQALLNHMKQKFSKANKSKQQFLKEKTDSHLVFEDDLVKDNSWVERFMVYPCALEDLQEFNSFESLFKTFPLIRGKQDDEEEGSNRVIGLFKGDFRINSIEETDFGYSPENFELLDNLPGNDPFYLTVRVYIIRAFDLHPTDPNGKSDPYVMLILGEQVINDRENYKPKTLEPVYGRVFEIKCRMPHDSILKIKIFDYDMIGTDDLIGETKIDLENRFFSRHRATCGLASAFDNFGYNKWRDQLLPTRILANMCKSYQIEEPVYEIGSNKVTVEKVDFYADSEILTETGDLKQSKEPLALEVLNNFSKIPRIGCPLVKEHIETRVLYSPEKAGLEQGRIQLWIDMFPTDLGPPPPPVDIRPRVPKKLELRVTELKEKCMIPMKQIWNTEEVIMADDSMLTGEASSDIFVKGWMKGLGLDDQTTDVHYRSLTGEGNFNWRFVFAFEYDNATDQIVYSKKDSVFAIDEMEVRAPCKLFLQVWDSDLVSADDFLGGIEFPISRIPRGAKTAASCGLHQLEKDGSVPTINMFHNKRYRGFWPCVAIDEDDPNQLNVTGKIDAELHLLTEEEAEQNPAGKGREEPNPLPQPNRPETSFLSMMNPLKVIKYLICTKFKSLLIKLLIISALLALVVLFIYAAPGYLVKKMIGA
ncbi:hypothetical protein Ciccas_000767 [Cichlidogyrus casuarinus]|uniref:C2 domain-containing protein n=1 Tax=Cichlidogyrus casuarinus TaxID=1844966 RepID=A0ABD2QMA2_9PLAT